jgi:predicted transposase/invertase (TIGR01784 family)
MAPKPIVPVAGKYIDPLVDFAFKKIFGNEPNKDLLIAFLNEVFSGRKQIVDLIYNKNEYPGDLKEEGGAIFDLLCTGVDGDKFIIEVQRGKQSNFKERALFYTSRLISDQAPKGKRNNWVYQLTEVYLIALLEDFTLDNNATSQYRYDICLCNRDTGQIFYDKLGYTYIELTNFVKKDCELNTDLDRWLFVLKNLSQMDKIPVYLRKPIFEKLFSIAEYTNLTKEEKTMYDRSLKYKWDNQNVRDYAVKKGLEQGLQQGLQQGIEKGRHEEAMAIARKLKQMGLNADVIAKAAGLSVAEIEKIEQN